MAKRKPEKPAKHRSKSRKKGGDRPKPRQRALEGMETVRNENLDAICEDIARHEKTIKKSKEKVDIALRDALPAMRLAGINNYHHDGVKLTRKPGSEEVVKAQWKEGSDDGVEKVEKSTSKPGDEF